MMKMEIRIVMSLILDRIAGRTMVHGDAPSQIPQVIVGKPRNREDLSRGWDVCVVDKSFVALDICSLLCNLKHPGSGLTRIAREMSCSSLEEEERRFDFGEPTPTK
ncbi:hypothetical protein DY000_02011985 [Brassica cretica]|uniref:Uncharacterized protein n=1 Tax=Brassica cretica TaxID=69181 RepID=A0ABQ7CQT0_BRACR|nr:hypothetical protein DY000_02011985 [Brassica cretica]